MLFENSEINQPLINFLTNISKPYFPELTRMGLTNSNLVKFLQEQWQSYVENENSLLDFKESLLNKSLGYLFGFEFLKPVKVSPAK